jgi:phosphinothricin acetyltransferase
VNGHGIGRTLLKALIAAAESEGYWTLQAQILGPNAASRSLHLKPGFREVGCRERYGHRNCVWHDVMLYKRRSVRTGGAGLPTKRCG